ncbi:MAG: Fe-S cluster assembly protein SufD, partial [Pseudobdellovibrionaceae bacterium]
PWLSIRQNGFRYFEAMGLPSKSDEAWHYTSLKSLPPELLLPQDQQKVSVPANLKENIKTYLNSNFHNLVFVNGVLVEALSDLKHLKKIKVVDLEKVEQTSTFKSIRAARKMVKTLRQDSMEALNSAFAQSGIVIEIPKETVLEKPLQVLYVQNSELATYPKTLVKVGSRSKLSLIETYVGGDQKSLTSTVTEVIIEASAKLEYTRVQAEGTNTTHVGCTRIFLKEQAALEALTYATGAALNRHNMDVYCMGRESSAQVNGLTLGAGEQHHDNHTLIDHVVGHCTTTQLYKSVLDGKSRAIFTGRVQIRENAQKASSDQLNKNLLLTSTAEADSKPELGIYADDVKATHGSTVGQLNADELFYFMSRAIPRDKAVEMLSLGFVHDLIDRVSNENIRTWLSDHLIQSYRIMKGQS